MLFILTRQAYFISHKRLTQGQTYTLVNFDQAYTTNKSWWWVHFHKIMGIHLERVIRAQWKKGITGFNNPKTSKVNKGLRLKFNSWNSVLLKFNLVIFLENDNLLDNENVCWPLTFWGYWKQLSPFSTEPFNYSSNVSYCELAVVLGYFICVLNLFYLLLCFNEIFMQSICYTLVFRKIDSITVHVVMQH